MIYFLAANSALGAVGEDLGLLVGARHAISVNNVVVFRSKSLDLIGNRTRDIAVCRTFRRSKA
jgi:hypothetical protein